MRSAACTRAGWCTLCFHDRVSFGGTLIAIGVLYLWLLEFPLRRGEEWAWWTLLLSGCLGFSSFFAYLIYGYLDLWHAARDAWSAAVVCCWDGEDAGLAGGGESGRAEPAAAGRAVGAADARGRGTGVPAVYPGRA